MVSLIFYRPNMLQLDFMFLWANRDKFIESFEGFCDMLAHSNYNFLLQQSYIMIGCIVSVLVLLLLYMIVYLVAVSSLVRFRSKFARLYSLIPKTQIGLTYHELEKRTVHFTHKMNYRKGSSLTSTRIFMMLCISCFLVTFISIGLILFEANYNSIYNQQAIAKVDNGANIIHEQSKLLFATINFGFEDEKMLGYSHEEIYKFATTIDPMQAFAAFRFGDADTGFYNLVGMSDRIDDLLLKKANTSCGNYSISDFTEDQITCMSLDELIDIDVYYMTKQLEDYYNQKRPPTELIDNFQLVFEVFHETRVKAFEIMNLSVQYFNSLVNQRLISGIGCALFALVIILVLFIQRYYSIIKKENLMLILMLHAIPCDVLENIEDVKYFIFNRDFDNKRKKASKNNDRKEVAAFCNSAVDGVILCSSAGVIEIFNPACETMFGHKANDLIGLAVSSLFDKSSKDKIESTLNRFRGSNESLGETFELISVRKNEKRFNTRVSLSYSVLDGSKGQAMVYCFIKDITQEIKHNNLINEEKRKSEALLLNILPGKFGKL